MSNYINMNVPLSDWMSGVFDHTNIKRMTIMGTHDSCAVRSDFSHGRCQSLSITQQLYKGARYLDIRCCVTSHDLASAKFEMHHGPIDERISFSDVMDECIEFLKKHPKEAIFMRIKQEHSSESNDAFLSIFNYTYIFYHYYMYFVDGKKIDRLSDIRGKIVIVSNVAGLRGIQWNDMKIQDKDEVYNYDEKWSNIKMYLDFAKDLNKDEGNNRYFLNGFNAHGPDDGNKKIEEVARNMKDRFLAYISSQGYGCCSYGFLAVDFIDIYSDDEMKKILYYNNYSNISWG